MGLFKRNKIDAKTAFIMEKTKGSQISGRAIALLNLKNATSSNLPEGMGRAYLKDDGSGFIWRMKNMQGIPIEDEIETGSPKSWGRVNNYSIFDWAASHFVEEDSATEVIAMDNGYWTIVFRDVDSYSEYQSVRTWFEEHYPGRERIARQ
jgi:hypothetical protein